MILLKEGDEDLEPDLGKNKKHMTRSTNSIPTGLVLFLVRPVLEKRKCDQEFDSNLRHTGNKASNALGSGKPPRPYLGHVGSI